MSSSTWLSSRSSHATIVIYIVVTVRIEYGVRVEKWKRVNKIVLQELYVVSQRTRGHILIEDD